MVKNDNTSRKALYEEAGKYLLDVSKLIFGGVILAGVMNLNVDKLVLFIVGGISVVLSAIVGFVLFKKGKEWFVLSYKVENINYRCDFGFEENVG